MPLQDADVKEVTSRLDTIVKLMGALFARGLNNNEAIIKLEKMQLTRDQIADALGITTANVAQVVYMDKKTEKKAKKHEALKSEENPEAITAGEPEARK